MVSGAVKFGIPTSIGIICGIFAIWLKYREGVYDALNEANPLWDAVEMDWDLEKLADNGYPLCYRPQIYRNVVKFPNNGECIAEDNCVSFVKNRLLEKFGERKIPLFSSDSVNGHSKTHWAVLNDFLTNPRKYDDLNVEGFTRVGNVEEYTDFLSFGENLQNYESLRNMGVKGQYGQYTHVGTTFYLIDNTPLHLEWGTNFYVMLGGRKRWLLVHPKYYETANCNLGQRALHGHCELESPLLANYTGGKDVPIDIYKEILLNEYKIPAEYMIDITLNPGDILVSCDLWLHATKKLDETGMAMSLRMAQPWNSRPYQTSTVKRVFESLWTGLTSKWYDPHLHSFIELYRQDLLENDERYNDPETFTCKNR